MEEKVIDKKSSIIFSLNPYTSVIEYGEFYRFGTSDLYRIEIKKNSNSSWVERLLNGEKINQEELEQYLSEEIFQNLLSKRILITNSIVENRYTRQVGYLSLLKDNYSETEEIMRTKHAIILGVGGIGSHVAWHLAAMGIGEITLVDYDSVEESNLNRQILYGVQNIGSLKVDAAYESLRNFNPHVKVNTINMKINTFDDVDEVIQECDIVVKAIDTPVESYSWVNKVCVDKKIPYISGGFIDYIGVYGPTYIPNKTPCAACNSTEIPFKRRAGKGGTIAPLTGIIASSIALECLKILIDWGPVTSAGSMAFYDSEFSRWKTQIIYRNDSCDICGNNKEENKDEQKCDNTDSIDVYTNTNGFWSFLRKASGQKRNPSRSSSSGTGDSNNNSFMHRIIYLQENTKLKLFLSLSMVMPLLVIMTNRLVLEDQWQSFCILVGGLLIILGSSMFFSSINYNKFMRYGMIGAFIYTLIYFILNIIAIIFFPTNAEVTILLNTPLIRLTDILSFIQSVSLLVVIFCILISLCLLVSGAIIMLLQTIKNALIKL